MVEESAMMEESAAIAKRPSSARSETNRDELEEGEIEPADLLSSELEAAAPPALRQSTHPLEHSWTFWFDNPSAKSKEAAWGSSILPVHTFATVEDFWGLYNNTHHPSKLAVGADFSCFKYGIEPKWEDPVCANGGKWTISCSKGKKVDNWWLYTLLAMTGEQFDHGDDICGAVVNVRAKQEKISIWTKNGLTEASQLSIGKQWKEYLDYIDTIGFIILHDDAKKYDRFAKSRYQV